MLLGPDGRVAFVEFKTWTGELSLVQHHAHDVLFRLGQTVRTVRSILEFEKFLQEWLS